MSKKIRFLIEGRRGERTLVKTLTHLFIDNIYPCDIVYYETTIYELYDNLIEGHYDSVVSLLSISKKITLPFNTKPSEAFSAIYLIFDYEPHYHKFSMDVIRWCQQYFCNKRENDK